MQTYQVTLTGKSPLLMHYDNIAWADGLHAWRDNPKHKDESKPGDDRSPAWTWIGSLYHDRQRVVLPSDNIMRCLMEAGAQVPVPGGRSGKTFKSQTQSGIMPGEADWEFTVGGKSIPFAPIDALRAVGEFAEHERVVATLGFALYTKRARIGAKKHIRVRPRFDRWEVSGSLVVTDKQITRSVLVDILTIAGSAKGLGDWRPSSRTPGPFGRFDAEVT